MSLCRQVYEAQIKRIKTEYKKPLSKSALQSLADAEEMLQREEEEDENL